MTAIPGLALGPLAGLALRFPAAAAGLTGFGKFVKINWKQLAIGLAIVGVVSGSYLYVKHLEKASYRAGVTAQFNHDQAIVVAANKRAATDNTQLQKLKDRFNTLSEQRQQQVRVVTQTKIERIHDEVQANPVYRQCSLTDGVFNDLQAVAAAVNSSVGASQH